jgi:hypothetical protein
VCRYGKVFKGTFRGRTVAIKTIEVKDDKELVLIRREISLLRECDHPNIGECCAHVMMMLLLMLTCS